MLEEYYVGGTSGSFKVILQIFGSGLRYGFHWNWVNVLR